MRNVCEGHLDNTWITVLTAVILSLLVNVVYDFDLTLSGIGGLSITVTAAISLVFYLRRWSSDLEGIKKDISEEEKRLNRTLHYREEEQIKDHYSKKIPRLFWKGRVVIVLTVLALLFTVMVDRPRECSREMNQVVDKLDIIVRKVDALTK